MSTTELRELLRSLQTSYHWPNKYFAWHKPDDTYFMIGIRSGLQNHIMLYTYSSVYKEYSAHLYNISPSIAHMRGPHTFDPVEDLVQQIQSYQYLGSWDDPDIYMPDRNGKEVLAHGRWDIALTQITSSKQKPNLSATLFDANRRKTTNKKLLNKPKIQRSK